MEEFRIHEAYITLTQFLKTKAYIASGGQAKFFLLENDVYVNGEVRRERKKKIYPGDTVVIGKERYIMKNDQNDQS